MKKTNKTKNIWILYNHCSNIGNKIFIKSHSGGLVNRIEFLPKNIKLIVEIK